MDSSQEPEGNVIDLAARARQREAAFLSLVDQVTRQMHYALMPIRTSILLARRDCRLPDIE